MLTRRHIRVKVMQAIYAVDHAKASNLDVHQKFLNSSIENMENLYLLLLSLLIELQKLSKEQLKIGQNKYLATEVEKNPSTKFVNNSVLNFIASNTLLIDAIEKKKVTHWNLDSEYVWLVYDAILESELYKNHMLDTTQPSFEADKAFIIELYKEVIAPNNKLYEYVEDHSLTWVDDLPLVNTLIVKKLKQLSKKDKDSYLIQALYKDEDDKKFTKELFSKTMLKEEVLLKEIEGKTPNWDKERIADVDAILLKMAICEFLFFPSIPTKVTINEYLEIAKEYSTPKSSVFINGVLDKLVKEYQAANTLNKTGRGLM